MSCFGALSWCPSGSDDLLPAILVLHPPTDPGRNEELAVSNGFRFGLRFLRSVKTSKPLKRAFKEPSKSLKRAFKVL